MDLQKFIKELEELGEWCLSLPSTFIAYYDDLYGYPWGRLKLLGSFLLMFACWFGAAMLIVDVARTLIQVSK
ncbi:hypothetical protein [Nostoc sp. 'Peltigera membranacea cyanobiont' 232]|uniref:hypothetical protein n=1 Tax=Nostoc sp. 'Peltigera membranacea cyanobiont' 232 TaxID=2014531 RepID=UPI000B956C0A|nr:hypothetical protein [Nostoc sp. 'Peltigera membranacea cyanobiont' 232]OYE03036.1 hypothetical protein CDG79_20580 [Nostoc sp. 'Peltigera membranacea cyanobiont' 232]